VCVRATNSLTVDANPVTQGDYSAQYMQDHSRCKAESSRYSSNRINTHLAPWCLYGVNHTVVLFVGRGNFVYNLNNTYYALYKLYQNNPFPTNNTYV